MLLQRKQFIGTERRVRTKPLVLYDSWQGVQLLDELMNLSSIVLGEFRVRKVPGDPRDKNFFLLIFISSPDESSSRS